MYDLMSYVKRGPNRWKILSILDTPKTPSEISRITGMCVSTASRNLAELTSKKLVRCLTPDEKMGRLYVITPLGLRVRGGLWTTDDL